MNHKEYYLAFSHCLGIGPVRLEALIKAFGSIQKAYEAPRAELTDIGGAHIAKIITEFRTGFDPIRTMREISKKGIAFIPRDDSHYPQALATIPDPPIALYARGNLTSIDFDQDQFFAIVGTRRPTSYGETITRQFAQGLASCGFVIVSGLALGVDALAHRNAIEVGGHTIAVLGCGVDIIYPHANRSLYDQIVKGGGVVISEFPPGMGVLPGLFVARNRIISGLSRGILVTEGLKDSGSLITARLAAAQGREVFASPAPITSELAAAPNLLIKEGAHIATSVDDILAEFNLQVTPAKSKDSVQGLGQNERKIYHLLTREPLATDEIIVEAGLTVDATLQALSIMEIQGIVSKNSDGKHQLKAI